MDLDDDFYEDIDLDADHNVEEKKKKEKEEEEENNNRWQVLHEKLINEEKPNLKISTNTTNDGSEIKSGISSSSNNNNIRIDPKLKQEKVESNSNLQNINTPTSASNEIIKSKMQENIYNININPELSLASLIEKIDSDFLIRTKDDNKNKEKNSKSNSNSNINTSESEKETNSDTDTESNIQTKKKKKQYSFVSLPGRLQLEILSYCSESELYKCLQTNFQISRVAAIILWGSKLYFGLYDKERLKLFVGALNRKPQIHPYANYVQNVTIENIMDEIPMYTRNPCWILVRELLYHCSKTIRKLKLGFQDEKFPGIKSLEISDIYFPSLEELVIEPYSDVSPEFITDLLKRCEANGRLKKLTIPNCFWGFIPFSVLAEIVRIGSSLVFLDLSAYKQSPKQDENENGLPELKTDVQIKEFNDLMVMLANSCRNMQYLNISHNIYLYDTTVEQFLITNPNMERIYLEDTHVSDYTLLALSHSAPPTINYIELKCGYIDNVDPDTPSPPTTKFTTSVLEMVLKEMNSKTGLCEIIAISLPDRLIQPGTTSLISTKVWLNSLEGCTLDDKLNGNDTNWRKWRKYGKLRLWV